MDYYVIKHSGAYLNKNDEGEYGWLMNELGEADFEVLPNLELAISSFDKAKSKGLKLDENKHVQLMKVNVLPVINEYYDLRSTDGISYFVTGHKEGFYGPLEMYDFDASMKKPNPGWVPIEGGFPRSASQFGTIESLEHFIEATNAYGDTIKDPVIYQIKQTFVQYLK